ncbi:hypothetical protein HMJ29_01180 [Hymenobacter taeanensis]|uniref:Lipoprotein n=1 Tax=Hymenobacter taeanensis TaxID=2735321 RepID=A0A6M6BC91_9BACT|nr:MULTISPECIES: hypothetical protein [Hymenobacter]QJX45619.1 hypothetical protein HMJ29_01180 [Hymenobacter taeanensis]UOQ79453.1 hypothetical protein MUN83_11355 [Hymenobacter sp. 5414T-23]
MKRALFLLLATGLFTSLTACDYRNTPGKDPQVSQDFTVSTPARATETNRDSISHGDEAYTPIGKGSAQDQQTSAQAGLEGSPSNPGSPNVTVPEGNSEVRGTARSSQSEE